MRNSAFAACARVLYRRCSHTTDNRFRWDCEACTEGGGQGREEGRRGGGGSRKKMRREMKGNKFPRPDQEFRGRGGVGGMVLSCAPRLDDDISA